jgi:hypothetical protein
MYLFDQHAGARFAQVVALERRLAEEEFVGEHPEGPEVDAWSVPKGDEMERTRGHEDTRGLRGPSGDGRREGRKGRGDERKKGGGIEGKKGVRTMQRNSNAKSEGRKEGRKEEGTKE